MEILFFCSVQRLAPIDQNEEAKKRQNECHAKLCTELTEGRGKEACCFNFSFCSEERLAHHFLCCLAYSLFLFFCPAKDLHYTRHFTFSFGSGMSLLKSFIVLGAKSPEQVVHGVTAHEYDELVGAIGLEQGPHVIEKVMTNLFTFLAKSTVRTPARS